MQNLLEPRTFLKIISGTVAACILTLGLLLVIIAQPYQSSLDLRQQAATTGLDCNQTCTSSAQCAINLRCYNLGAESRCRLALNPASSSCQVANIPISDGSVTKGGLDSITPPGEPSPTLSPDETPAVDSLTPTVDPSGTDSAALTPPPTDIDPSPPSDATDVISLPPNDNKSSLISQIRNWWQEFNSPEQSNSKRMLIVVVSVGLILIGLALILSSRGDNRDRSREKDDQPTSKTKQSAPTETSTVKPASPSNKAVIASVASQPESDPSTPPPSTLTTSNTSSPTPPKHANTNQPVPTAVSSAQLYPSGGMTARLKQKGVTPPT